MAVIKKSDIKRMTPKEAEAKIAELEKAMLILEGEGKREKKKPLKKAIAKLKTLLNSQKTLNTSSAPKNNTTKKTR